MSAAAESASFHYLQHKQVVFTPNYIKVEASKPPTYQELWCVGFPSGKKQIRREEKLYWRTRHRLDFIIEEDRLEAVIIIHIFETESKMV